MANIHTLNEINNGAPLVSGNKLGDSPSNRYPSSRTELENQLACLKHDLDIALIQLGTRNTLLIKNNESFSERVCQLEDEIQALQSEIKELEMKYFLAQKDLSEMDSLRRELAQSRQNVELKNVDLDLKEDELSEKKGELMRTKTLSEKEILHQEANNHLAEQIPKTSTESEVLGGVSGLEKDNGITSPETTPKVPNSLFFQHAIIFAIVLLIIYFLWRIFSYLYSFISPINEEKNLPNYKIPINRNYSYGFPIHNAEEPKNRTTSYETSSFGYG
ncbi:8813_t:CDS:2 [Ambispora gerdemannii]|uniref:8813_t:CDS:1 n=1 Tax=Ambispora gerdemannii TaxID=144530 RepID=A0A9N9GKD2_9GLOM|nr:8813_t:CDS:2 [Ambispora gerdemannii]